MDSNDQDASAGMGTPSTLPQSQATVGASKASKQSATFGNNIYYFTNNTAPKRTNDIW